MKQPVVLRVYLDGQLEAVKQFTESQIAEIVKYAEVFLSQWDSHGKRVNGAFQILKNRFAC